MGKINRNQIEILVKLQDLEAETEQLKSRIYEIPQQYELLNAKLQSFQQKQSAAEDSLKELKKIYRALENDLQYDLIQTRKSETKARSVKTNKEYQSILKEIEDLKKKSAQIEDQMLDCLEKIEFQEDFIRSQKVTLKQLEEEINGERQGIQKESDLGKSKLGELEKAKAEVSNRIEPDLLRQFLKIKERQGGGISIVPVNNAVCEGCNLNIPPQMYNELQRLDSLKFCPNCQRLIYWKDLTQNNPQAH